MKTNNSLKPATKTFDLGNNESVMVGVVAESDGTFTALTRTRSRNFKTIRGAWMWFHAATGGHYL